MNPIDQLVTLVEIDAWDPTRSNLLRYSRQQDNAAWVKSNATVTANAATAPDNQAVADKLVENGAASTHYAEQACTTAAANTAHILSAYAKQSGRDLRMVIYGTSSSDKVQADFNLTTGAASGATTGGTGSSVTAGIQALGNGWYRCWVAGIPQSGAGVSVSARLLLLSGASESYAGNSSSAVFLDRLLLETGTTLRDPIETTATAGPGIKTLRYSTHKFVTSGTDTPPHVWFDPRLTARPSLTRLAFGNGVLGEPGEVGDGILTLANEDQALATWLSLGLDGRAVTIRVGEAGGAYPTDYPIWMKGTLSAPQVGTSSATLRLRDKTRVLDLPLHLNRYAGTNSAGSGAEGEATDIKGQVKPYGFGRVKHAPAILVNTQKWIYQVHDGAIQAIDAVYDKGLALTSDGDVANLAALEAWVPVAGRFKTCLALGLVRIHTEPNKPLTVSFQGNATGSYINKTGAIIQRILTDVCGIPTAEINTSSFSTLDTDLPYEVGLWEAGEITRSAAIQKLLASVAGYLTIDRAGLWTVGYLKSPTGSAVLTLDEDLLSEVERVATGNAEQDLPVKTINLRWGPYEVQFGEQDLLPASTIGDTFRAGLLQQWRTSTNTSATVAQTYLLAPTITIDTRIVSSADAATELTRRAGLHSTRRDLIKVPCPVSDDTGLLELGNRIDLVTPLMGYDAGRSFILLGIDLGETQNALTLWG